ncbi:MAG: ATP-binding protein [Myxococcota bacterium]
MRRRGADALVHGTGIAKRPGETGTAPLLLTAVATAGPEPIILRLSLPLTEVEEAVAELRTLLLLAALVGLGTAILMSGVASALLSRTLRTVVDNTVSLVYGERSDGAPLVSQNEIGQLAGPFNQIASDLKNAVTELAGETDRLGTILECMQEAVVAVDSDGRMVLANGAAHDLLDIDDDDIGRPFLEAFRAPGIAELIERWEKEGSGTLEFTLVKPPYRKVLANGARLEMMGGVVVVAHDVTDIRRLERMRRDFVANVSHELRTPIAVIQANAETLLGGALEDGGPFAHRFVDAIFRNADRLSQLIAELLDLSRIEAGELKLSREPVSLRDTVEGVVQALGAKIGDRGTEVHVEVSPRMRVVGDHTAIEQVITNFIDNAIKYAGGRVWVRARRVDGGRSRIEVEDDGPGIEPHHRGRIFERFYRVDRGRSRDVGGTGLGLAIVKHLVEAMGGRVGVDAAASRGSIFWVELPAVLKASIPAPDSSDSIDPSDDSDALQSREVAAQTG